MTGESGGAFLTMEAGFRTEKKLFVVETDACGPVIMRGLLMLEKARVTPVGPP